MPCCTVQTAYNDTIFWHTSGIMTKTMLHYKLTGVTVSQASTAKRLQKYVEFDYC